MTTAEFLLARKLGGGSSPSIVTEALNVTQNGTYTAPSGKAYTPVNVAVDGYALKSLSQPSEIASFTAAELPLNKLKVAINAVQDLHGYDAPWVSGAGKNKLPLTVDTIKSLNTSGTWSGNVYTNGGISYEVLIDSGENITGIKVMGTYSSTAANRFNLYADFDIAESVVLNGCPSGGGSTTYRLNWANNGNDNGSGVSVTTPTQGNISIVIYNITSGTTLTFYPMVRLATVSDATFAPYSNICPISGWDEVNVYQNSKNLIGLSGGWSDSGVFDPTARAICSNLIRVKQGDTFIASKAKAFTATYSRTRIYMFSEDGTFISYDNILGYQTLNGSAFTIPSGVAKVGFAVNLNEADSQDLANIKLQVEIGDSITTYEPYNGATTTISLPQTVFGGEVDVVNGTSGNRLTHGEVDLGSLTWSYSSGQGRFSTTSLSEVLKPSSGRSADGFLCSCFECAIEGTDGYLFKSGTTVYVYDSTHTDASAFTSAVTGQTLVYELATPSTLTTQPNLIKALDGTNNISADTGEVLECEWLESL